MSMIVLGASLSIVVIFHHVVLAVNAGTTFKLDDVILVNATRSSVTLEAETSCGIQDCDGELLWGWRKNFKSPPHWIGPSSKVVGTTHVVTFSQLRPKSTYLISVGVLNGKSKEIEAVVHEWVTTCPEIPFQTPHMTIIEVEDQLKLCWEEPYLTCQSTSYNLLWFESSGNNRNVSLYDCPEDGRWIGGEMTDTCGNVSCMCHTLDTRDMDGMEYSFEIRTTDATGFCSNATTLNYTLEREKIES